MTRKRLAERTVEALRELRRTTNAELAKYLNVTESSARAVTSEMKRAGLIASCKTGRKCQYWLVNEKIPDQEPLPLNTLAQVEELLWKALSLLDRNNHAKS